MLLSASRQHWALVVTSTAAGAVSGTFGRFCLQRNSGPRNQAEVMVNSDGGHPLEVMSAGFSVVETCLHWPGSDKSRVCCKRLAT